MAAQAQNSVPPWDQHLREEEKQTFAALGLERRSRGLVFGRRLDRPDMRKILVILLALKDRTPSPDDDEVNWALGDWGIKVEEWFDQRDTLLWLHALVNIAPRNMLRVFLCHAKEDAAAVDQLFYKLSELGFGLWLDRINLLPGQHWRLEIERAIRDSDIVMVCLSHRSISKTGYVNREISVALDASAERPEGAVYLVPVRLEDCVVPDRLRHLHYADLFADDGIDKLTQVLLESL